MQAGTAGTNKVNEQSRGKNAPVRLTSQENKETAQ
jgi:hypothetical protein